MAGYRLSGTFVWHTSNRQCLLERVAGIVAAPSSGKAGVTMNRIHIAKRVARTSASLILGLYYSAACSSSRGVEGGHGAVGGGSGYPDGGAVGGMSGYKPGVSDSGTGVGGDSGNSSTTPTADANCGVETSSTTKRPTDVLLVLDRSGSMSESIDSDCCCTSSCRTITGLQLCTDTLNCTQRWPALTTAITATMSASTSIDWGLKLYSSPSQSNTCGVTQSAEVAIASGSSSALQKAITDVSPAGNTPTASAISAATAYLQTVTDPNTKVILLATDGQPNCKAGARSTSDSDVAGTTTALAAALTAGYKTYVIGIGPSVGNLDNFAQAGGTEHYYPATSAQDLADALAAISKAVSSCTFEMSQNPPDEENVAVYLDGALLPKDSTNGWSFGANPQTVVLNGTTCEQISSGAATKVQVLFGCPGQTPPQIL